MTDQNVSADELPANARQRPLHPIPADMPMADQDLPDRFRELALYASLVATCVIALNMSLVKFARWTVVFRARSHSRKDLRLREPRS
jgi:hypothetical protein